MRPVIPVCPKCDVGLLIATFRDVEVDYCDRCRGLWLDAGELETLMRITGATAEDPLLEFQHRVVTDAHRSQQLCPRCDRRLEEIEVASSLHLDRCPRGHGLWFDRDELPHLLALYPADHNTAGTIAYLNDVLGVNPTNQPRSQP
jgi:Zn-finger nucleic acid-binding protein